MGDLRELIARVEKLEGPSREVDAALFIALVEPTWHTSKKDPGAVASDTGAFWPEGKLRYITRGSRRAPLYTASLDAAIALCERVLPGWGWDVSSNTEHIKACLDPENGDPVGKHPHWAAVANTSRKRFHDGASPAIALVLATLRTLTAAMEARHD